MAWWVYKCNDNGQFQRGNWDYVFKRTRATSWGTTRIRGLRQLHAGDQVIAYQTDREEIVGLTEVTRIRSRGGYDEIIMRPVEKIGASVPTLKRDYDAIATIPAFQPGFPKTLYSIEANDARLLLRAARNQQHDGEANADAKLTPNRVAKHEAGGDWPQTPSARDLENGLPRRHWW